MIALSYVFVHFVGQSLGTTQNKLRGRVQEEALNVERLKVKTFSVESTKRWWRIYVAPRYLSSAVNEL